MSHTQVIGRYFRSLARQLRALAVLFTAVLLLAVLSAWGHLAFPAITATLCVAFMLLVSGFRLAARTRSNGRSLDGSVTSVEFTDHGVDLTADQASVFVGWSKLREARFGRDVVLFVSPFGSIVVSRDAVTEPRLSEVCDYLREAGVAMRGRLPRQPAPAQTDPSPSS